MSGVPPTSETFEANPYAAPQPNAAPVAAGAPAVQNNQGIWRKGNLLVVHRNATLPELCIRSGEPVTDGHRWKKNFQWHPPWIVLLIFVGLLVYVIVALIMTKRMQLEMSLSPHWRKVRRRRIAIGWALGLSGLAMLIGGIVYAMNTVLSPSWVGWLCFAGFLLALGGLIYGVVASRMVVLKFMDDHYVHLKGVHPSILERYPEVPPPTYR